MEFEIPYQVKSDANRRGHSRQHAGPHREQRELAKAKTREHLGGPLLIVTLTRIIPKGQREYDDDNLRGAMKYLRDGICSAMLIDDKSKAIRFEYVQEKTNRPIGSVGVRIEPAG